MGVGERKKGCSDLWEGYGISVQVKFSEVVKNRCRRRNGDSVTATRREFLRRSALLEYPTPRGSVPFARAIAITWIS